MFGYELEARLCRAEVELAEDRPEARVHLEEVQRLADAQHYGLIANTALRLAETLG